MLKKLDNVLPGFEKEKDIPRKSWLPNFISQLRLSRDGKTAIQYMMIFVEKPFIAAAPDWQDDEFFYHSGDLASYYHDWEILLSGERIFDGDSSHTPHRHAVSYLIVKKPL